MNQQLEFDDYFKYFVDYGIRDTKIPSEYEEQALLYYYDCFEKFRDKFGELSKSASSFVPILIKLTFAFQYFCERRLRVKPSFKGMNNENPMLLSSHPSLAKLNKEYDHYYFSLTEEDLKESKKRIEETMHYASVVKELNKASDTSDIARINVQISLIGRGNEKIEMPRQFYRYLLRELDNLFFSYRAQMLLFNSVSNHKRSMPIIISMVREPLVKYLREKFKQFADSSDQTRKAENLLTTLVLAGAGYLKNSTEYKQDPEYKDRYEKLSYFEYLYLSAENVKTKKELLDNDIDSYENPAFSYGLIPFMFNE